MKRWAGKEIETEINNKSLSLSIKLLEDNDIKIQKDKRIDRWRRLKIKKKEKISIDEKISKWGPINRPGSPRDFDMSIHWET